MSVDEAVGVYAIVADMADVARYAHIGQYVHEPESAFGMLGEKIVGCHVSRAAGRESKVGLILDGVDEIQDCLTVSICRCG